ncbi:MAG: DUF5320 domain-containing protein [Clostridia bacterium]|nr:DUF5320 domain-containing protein [Clostridia bacterium]
MPRRNGTGPMGTGSRTGRGLGNCFNSNIYNNTPTAKNCSNKENLLEEKRILEERLKNINEKLSNN